MEAIQEVCVKCGCLRGVEVVRLEDGSGEKHYCEKCYHVIDLIIYDNGDQCDE